MKSIPTGATPPLTADQLRVAQLYAAMDDFTQKQMLNLFIALAVKFPRHVAPTLCLVKGGAA